MGAPYNLPNPNSRYYNNPQVVESFQCQTSKSYKCPHAGCQASWDKDESAFNVQMFLFIWCQSLDLESLHAPPEPIFRIVFVQEQLISKS